ncbi:2-amino-4-hydroxy-6-hydroxymethyldihydropteridine diphosphokinase [Tessaracoccus oleiagri]|uniref:2-amino-4-hydroxy-6-hydroxymethyldihydropteridine diphosphokinase n=1 Tax=Tessaracoccus oleiagri TaxID=686624 RepID=A0A1G9MXA8_9ACTN|nr:2-amino-4-hydroxy-6-hydroxymethyldihydropteridine diphosphokinase [Tessaracoccus oleiagri]SDL78849.1 2-amino-4-hydroxy-6-hydroxymethyldihydropteridinediphosphokinase [Tessaracoccus oleiagri]
MSNGPFDIDVDTLGNLRPISKVVFSLGSNQGDSAAILQQATDFLAETPGLMLVDVSPVYETAPWGDVPDQPNFLNMVIVAESTMEPLTLLDRALAIEENFGRERDVPGGPRTLDIDIVMVGRRVSEGDIELPHPHAHERGFVLVPWLDIDPNAELEGHGPIADLVEDVDTEGIVRRDDIVIIAPTGF